MNARLEAAVSHYVKDASGHEHKGKGEGGGQFTGSGSGGNAVAAAAKIALHPPGSAMAQISFGKETLHHTDKGIHQITSKHGHSHGQATLSTSPLTADYSSLPQMQTAWKKIVGDGDARKDVGRLLGTETGSKITLAANKRGNAITATVKSNEMEAEYHFYRDPQGKRAVHIEGFYVNDKYKGQGIGSRMLTTMVKELGEAGFDYIECHAAKQDLLNPKTPMDGYWYWPSRGFDQDLSDPDGMLDDDIEAYDEARRKFPEAKTLLDIYETEGGAAWWKQNGVDALQVRFQLQAGSRSQNVLASRARGTIKHHGQTSTPENSRPLIPKMAMSRQSPLTNLNEECFVEAMKYSRLEAAVERYAYDPAFEKVHNRADDGKFAEKFMRLMTGTPRDAYSREEASEQYHRLWTPADEQKHPRGGNQDNSGQFSKVKISTEKLGNRHYAFATLPGGREIARSHESADDATRLAMHDIRESGYDFEDDEQETAATPAERVAKAAGTETISAEKHWNTLNRSDRQKVLADLKFPPGHVASVKPFGKLSPEMRKTLGKHLSEHPPEPVVEPVRKSKGVKADRGERTVPLPEISVFPSEETGQSRDLPKPSASSEDGPQEGDINAEGLIFHEHRWHTREEAAQQRAEKASMISGVNADAIPKRPDWMEREEHFKEMGADDVAKLLEADGVETQRADKSRVGKPAGIGNATLPAKPGVATGSGGGLGILPQGASGHGIAAAEVATRSQDVPARGEGNGAGRPAGTAGRSGAGGRGLGLGSGNDGVSESLNAPPTPENPTDVSAGNWRYHSRDFFAGGIKAKFRNNLEALKTMRLIQEEGRNTATPAEQEVLSKFVGWGAMPGLFNENWQQAKEMAEENHEKFDWDTWTKDKDKWTDERKLIRPLLSDDEWAAARKATLNSHFTHPSVVDAHWKMAQQMGFKGGRFLEPSAGIGYYLGLMPPELAGKTRSSAVELDTTTGNMLKLMYPATHVEVTGFENQKSPDDFYDLVASNVPFGAYKVHDPRYNKHRSHIHDYFFLKSADVVKPGGMVMHVTSTGSMDKPNDKIRRELAKTCDFVGAVRFPGDTHQANAGTSVVTDMILLRKRHAGEQPVTLEHTPPEAMPPDGQSAKSPEWRAEMQKEGVADEPGFTGTTTDSLGRVYHWVDGKRVPGPDWFGVKQVPDPAGGEPITVNAYFADHPEQILGTLDRTGSMYRGESVNVSKTDDYEERLQAAIDRLPGGVFTTGATPRQADAPEQIEATSGVKDGGYVIHDGKLFKREGGGETEQKINAKDLERIAGQLDIRDSKQAVVDAELAGEASEVARAKLNKVYDAYVAKFGPLSNRENAKLMRYDPDAPNLLALEKYNPTTKTAKKADMFERDTIRARSRASKADSVGEGVGICLNETAGVDPARIAELTGKDQAAVERELVASGLAFEDPSAGWTPADQYLSGNVRQKLVMARAAAAIDPKYNANVEALATAQPEDIDYQEIDVRLGAGWVPASDIAKFVQEVAGVRDGKHLNVNYIESTGEWQFRYDGNWTAGTGELSTERKSFSQIMDAVLNNRSLAVHDTIDDKSVLNKEETLAAQVKAQELKDQFEEWVWSDDARRDRLHRLYNDNFNNIRPLQFDGSHLSFPGMKEDFKMRALQKNFVWQVVSTGKGLAAHEVGTGKTASMVAAAMELRRLGLAKKPMIAVKKANIEQITQEALDLYPGAKILSTADNFDAKNRKATIARMATGDYDMVIMTHDQMDLLAMSPETQEKFIDSELADLRAARDAAWQKDPSKNNRVVKALEASQAKLEAKLKAIIESSDKDDAVNFEETGIDQIFVDEFHRYKSLNVVTHGERVKGVPQSQSNRASNMLMRAQWLQERNGGRGLVAATGTPVANTMAELYNIQRYLQPEQLKERGLSSFDAWASTFGDRQTEMEPTVTGDYQSVTRFSKFVNIPELMQLAGQVMDVQRADDQKNPDGTPTVIRPKRQDKIVTTPSNDNTKRMMDDLVKRAQEIKLRGKPEKGMDNMAVVCSDGRKGSVDARMIFKDAEDDPTSKLNQCVDNILKLSKQRPGTTQLIFSNVGVNPSPQTGFHLYGDVIEKLVKGGIPRSKIADFSTLEGPKKDAAQEAMRRGDIIVGIGSTEKLGTGTNVQHKVMAMHHLDVPWQPAEIEQRDGRGYRCGNRNDPTKPANEQKVDIYRYVSEGSLDTFMWNLVGKKAHFINQVIGGKGKSRTVSDEDTETLTPEQLMAVASGDPRILRKVQLESDVRELKMAENRSKRDESKRHDNIKKFGEHLIPETVAKAAKFASDATHLEGQNAGKDEFSMKLGGATHLDRKAAGEAIEKHLATVEGMSYWERSQLKNSKIGEYKGFAIHAPTTSYGDVKSLELEGPSGNRYPVRASVASMDAVMRGIARTATEHTETAAKLRGDLATMKTNLGKGFKRSGEYAKAKTELDELEKALMGESRRNQTQPEQQTEQYSRFTQSLQRSFRAMTQKRKPVTSQARLEHAVTHYAGMAWDESKHKRGKPKNAGQFAESASSTANSASHTADNAVGHQAAARAHKAAASAHGQLDTSRENMMGKFTKQKIADHNKSASDHQKLAAWHGKNDGQQRAANLPIVKAEQAEPTTAPPPGGYAPNPADGKAARVGVPGNVVPPPPKIGRLNNLNPEERAIETQFASMFEADPDGMAKQAIEAMANGLGDGPNIFATDEMKDLFPQWKGTKVPVNGPDGRQALDKHGKPVFELSPETKEFRSKYNTALHQTANGLAKRAFVQYLDTVVAKQPPEQRNVLVTAGGVAAGKGYALEKVDSVNSIAQMASATWDTAGEQNSTELPWLADECKKRGIKLTAVFVHADPMQRWENPGAGVVERAAKKGRMVDARAFADSYTHGPKNFADFHAKYGNDPNVQSIILDNRGKVPQVLSAVPPEALSMDPEHLYSHCIKTLAESSAPDAVKQGGAAGVRIWGAPKV